jgi:hypothetical protein
MRRPKLGDTVDFEFKGKHYSGTVIEVDVEGYHSVAVLRTDGVEEVIDTDLVQPRER